MLEHIRARWTRAIRPIVRALLRLGIHPDAVTWFGTVAVTIIALLCFPQGWLWQGTLAMLPVIFSDSLDGAMARESGCTSKWGAFLDSTLDRIADGAVLAGLALYFAGPGQSRFGVALALGSLVFAQVTSYSKARGETVGVAVRVGLVGRADRLVIGLTGTLLTGLGVRPALLIALTLLLIGGAFTVAQRFWVVYRATHSELGDDTIPDCGPTPIGPA